MRRVIDASSEADEQSLRFGASFRVEPASERAHTRSVDVADISEVGYEGFEWIDEQTYLLMDERDGVGTYFAVSGHGHCIGCFSILEG